jgi:hypothetical protein
MPKLPKTKIVVGDHFADILVRYTETEPPVYYWICQRFDSAEILGLGTASTFEEAEREAKECLERLTNSGSCDVEPIDPLQFRIN